MMWIRVRALTLTLMAMFILFLAGQLFTGLAEYNSEQAQHGQATVALANYFGATREKPSSRTGKASSCRWPCSCC
jgi:hypothetical protein